MATSSSHDATSTSEAAGVATPLNLMTDLDEVTTDFLDELILDELTLYDNPTFTAERGDLELVVTSTDGTQTQEFLVWSRCIRIASPIWAEKLDATEASCTFDRTRYIHIFEDRVDLLILILNACHLFHDRVPSFLWFDDLAALAELCSAHGIIISILRPFMNPWVDSWRYTIGNPEYYKWLTIAFDFGLREIFTWASEAIARQMRTADGSSLVLPDGTTITSTDLPSTILSHLFMVRAGMICDLIECYDKHIKHLGQSIEQGEPNIDCRRAAMAHLCQEFYETNGTGPFSLTNKAAAASNVETSVAELLVSLLTMETSGCNCPHNGEGIHEDFSVPPIQMHQIDFVARNTVLDEHFLAKEAIQTAKRSDEPPIPRHRKFAAGKVHQPQRAEFREPPVWKYAAITEHQMVEADWADEDAEDEKDLEYRYRAPGPDEEPNEEYYEDDEGILYN